MMQKRTLRSALSLLLVLCLLFGSVGTALAVDYSDGIDEAELAEIEAEVAAAYAQAYADAKAAGYIDAAIAGIDVAIAEVEAAAEWVKANEVEYKDDVLATLPEAVETLVAAKALILEADVLDQATLDALVVTLEAAAEALEKAMVVADQAYADYAAPHVQAAYDKLVNEIIPQVKADLQAVIAAAVNAVIAEITAKLAELDAAITAKVNAAVAEIEAQINALIAEVEAAIAEIEAQIAELEAELKTAVDEAKAAIEAKIAELKAKVDAVVAQVKVLYKAVMELKAAAEAAMEEGIAAIVDVKAAAQKVIAEVNALIDVLPPVVAEKLEELDAAIVAALTELYNNAISAEYVVGEDSYYVAIGDDTAVSESYVDLLAAELGVDYKNLAGKEIDAAEIAKADLVTLGYGANNYNAYMLAALTGEVVVDWTAYVSAENAAYIDAALADVYAYLLENAGDETTAAYLTVALEAYAYAYVTYVTTYPEFINEIHAINPEALVVIVGMYNPLEGLIAEGIDLGEYFQYIVDATNLHTLAYAMLNENVIYVDAPAVETVETVATIEDLLAEVGDGFAGLVPNEDGHEYIKTQIVNALTVAEEETALLGDANGDGVVNNVDAMLVLQHFAGLSVEINTAACDVNGDGKINNVDAMLILQYFAGIITVFPV